MVAQLLIYGCLDLFTGMFRFETYGMLYEL